MQSGLGQGGRICRVVPWVLTSGEAAGAARRRRRVPRQWLRERRARMQVESTWHTGGHPFERASRRCDAGRCSCGCSLYTRRRPPRLNARRGPHGCCGCAWMGMRSCRACSVVCFGAVPCSRVPSSLLCAVRMWRVIRVSALADMDGLRVSGRADECWVTSGECFRDVIPHLRRPADAGDPLLYSSQHVPSAETRTRQHFSVQVGDRVRVLK